MWTSSAKTAIVIIDASVAFKWVVEEPDSGDAIGWIGRTELIAPVLIHAEVGNALWKRVRRGELRADEEIDARIADLSAYVRTMDETPFLPRALRMAIELQHPVYDCVYLAMAEHLDDELLTADKKFVRVAAASSFRSRIRGLGT